MVLVRILQRKDAASLVVAIAAGLVVAGFVGAITSHLADLFAGIDTNASFRDDYWRPFVGFVLQLLALEALARLAVLGREQIVRR